MVKVLIFAMNGVGAEHDVRNLIETLQLAGHSCIRANYWTSDYLPRTAFANEEVPFVTLIDGGLSNAPRMTSEDYAMAGGNIKDFADLALHDHAVNGWPLSEARMSLESMYYQQLRGVALKARSLLASISPDIALIPHGAETIARAISVEAHGLGIPTAVFESSFFPGFMNLDIGAQHFFRGLSRIDREVPDALKRPLDDELARKTTDFMNSWRNGRISKYEQETEHNELERLSVFCRAEGGPVAFLPLQIATDANIMPGLGEFSTLDELYGTAVQSLGGDWRIVAKRHPLDTSDDYSFLSRFPNVLVVKDLSIHDLIEACDVVLTHSSNVGLEALMLDKNTVVLGTPFYAGRGLTTDVNRFEELDGSMRTAATSVPDADLVKKLVSFLINDHLIPRRDATRINTRIAEAKFAHDRILGCLGQLAAHYPPAARRYLEKIAQYDNLAKQNFFEPEIWQQIEAGLDEAASTRDQIDSGERQIPFDYANVEIGHLTRYCLAKDLLEKDLCILDIACGTGYGTHLLGDKASTVVGVDASHEAVDFASSAWARENVSFYASSAARWFATDQTVYDAIVSFETVEHMYNAEGFVEEAWSRIRPGGVLMLSSPNAEYYPLTTNPFHVRHYEPDELRSLLQRLVQVEEVRVLPQLAGFVGPNVQRGRFLFAIATKAGGVPAISKQGQIAFPYSIADVPRRRTFSINADAFSTNVANRGAGTIWTDLRVTDTHIVYGPYKSFLPGSYVAKFNVTTTTTAISGAGFLTIEVVNTAGDLLARGTIAAEQVFDPTVRNWSLPFVNPKFESPLEFRVHVSGRPVEGTLTFHGVAIEATDENPA